MALFDDSNRLRDPRDVTIGGTPSARHEADALRSAGDRSVRSFDRRQRIEPVVFQNVGFGPAPLRTVRAVLRTQTALHVHDQVELDPVAEKVAPNEARSGDDLQ